MPYDLQTPFGTIPGQVSPYEQLQAQTAARMRSQAAADDASSAQMHVLKQAMGGNGDDDKFFSPSGPFGIAPKETGAVDLGARNAMVDRRQQIERHQENQAEIARGPQTLDATTRGDLARGEAGVAQGRLDAQQQAQGYLRDMLKGFSGGSPTPGGSAGAPDPGNAGVTSDTTATANGSAAGEDPYERIALMQAIGSLANGGQGPDIAAIMGKRQAMAREAQMFELDRKSKEMELAKAQRADAAGNVGASPASLKPEEQATYQAALAQGKSPAEANADVVAQRKQANAGLTDAAIVDFEGALDRVGDASYPFLRTLSRDFGDAEGQQSEKAAVLTAYRSLMEKLRASGLSPEDALARARSIALKKRSFAPSQIENETFAALGIR